MPTCQKKKKKNHPSKTAEKNWLWLFNTMTPHVICFFLFDVDYQAAIVCVQPICLCSRWNDILHQAVEDVLERGYNCTLRTHKTLCGCFCYAARFYFYKRDCRVQNKAPVLWNQTLLHKTFFFMHTGVPRIKTIILNVPEYADHFPPTWTSDGCLAHFPHSHT